MCANRRDTNKCKVGKKGCALSLVPNRKKELHLTGIDPRHKLNYLSLLPSGPDEVRNRLLHGDRSLLFNFSILGPKERIQPRISGFRDKGTANSPPSTTALMYNLLLIIFQGKNTITTCCIKQNYDCL